MDVHPDHLRRRALAAAPSTPWVTYYGPAPGERVELSRATLDNWVAKAGGLLIEEFDVDDDSVIALDLPCHWLLHVWTWAAWAVGATVAAAPGAGAAGLVIATPESTLARAGRTPVLAVGSHILGRPLAGATPPGCFDAMAEVLTYPDVLVVSPPSAGSRAVICDDGSELTGAGAVAAAARLCPAGARRLLVACPRTDAVNPPGSDWLLAATLSAATTDGSVVLVHPEVTSSRVTRITADEQVDATVVEPGFR